MHAEVVDREGGEVELKLAVSADEIDDLVSRFHALKSHRDRRLCLSRDGAGRLADMEIRVATAAEPGNMRILGLAGAPGSRAPRSFVGRAEWEPMGWRSLVAGALGFIGIWEGIGASTAAFLAHPRHDVHSVLVRGMWDAAWALVAFHVAAVVAGGMKARIVSLVGAGAVIAALVTILGRLT